MNKTAYQAVEDFRGFLWSYHTNNPAVLENRETVLDGLLMLYICWYDLIPSSRPILRRNMHTWGRIMIDTFPDCIVSLKELDEILVDTANKGTTMSQTTFKGLYSNFCRAFGIVIAPIKDAVTLCLASDVRFGFWSVHTALSFLSRLNIKSDELMYRAIDKFIEDDLSVTDASWEELSWIFEYLLPRRFRSSFYSVCVPKHGNGAVAELGIQGNYLKYLRMSGNQRTRFMSCHMDTDLLAHAPLEEINGRFNAVPKAVDKYRVTIMESIGSMYLQQGVLAGLKYLIKHHPILRKHINLERSDLNADQARLGSYAGRIATIDLSSASDSVPYHGLKQATKNTLLNQVVICCRTPYVDILGIPYKLKKFAGMGNAVTFPIECLVFLAICIHSVWSAGYISDIGDLPNCLRVYGDDITCPVEWAECIISGLQHFGFRVNLSKSFYNDGGHFRESCGGEYLDGVDVTPLRISRKFHSFRLEGQNIPRLVALANRYSACKMLRSYIIRRVLTLPDDKIPMFSVSGDIGFQSDNPTNYRLPIINRQFGRRIDPQYNVKHGQLVTHRHTVHDEELRYYLTLLMYSRRGPDPFIKYGYRTGQNWFLEDTRVVLELPATYSWETVKTLASRAWDS
jgi:hypothetical protein